MTRTSGVLGIADEPARARLAWKVAMPTPTSDNITPRLRFGPATPDALPARVGRVDRDAMWWAVEEAVRLGLVSSTGEIECGPDGLWDLAASRPGAGA
jgi:hypothetical protein